MKLLQNIRMVSGLAAAVVVLFWTTGCASRDHLAEPSGLLRSSKVIGGQQPVSGSHVYLMAAGMGGLGSASTSLLVRGRTGVNEDAAGRGFVITDAQGQFSLTSAYDACADPSQQVYLIAQGGNPGLRAGTDNQAITLAASLGACGTLNASQNFQVNELTTVAFASAFAPYVSDAWDVGVPAGLSGGLSDAAAAAANLVDITSGGAKSAVGTLTMPSAAVNTLGDALAGCVNATSPDAFTCAQLFSATGSAADTLAAAVAIANQPATHVDAIFALSSAEAPFQPTLSSAPADWTLSAHLPVSATTAGVTVLGDSISTIAPGNGATPYSLGYAQQLADALGAPFDLGGSQGNYSQGGDEALDAASKAWSQAAQPNTGVPPFTLMIGTNDVYYEILTWRTLPIWLFTVKRSQPPSRSG